MIRIQLQNPPSLHARKLRAEFRKQCERVVPKLYPRIYSVHFRLMGHYYDSSGEPTTRDADNALKVALDEIARAGGLKSKNGKRADDRWLQRKWSGLEVVESERELLVVTLS